MIKVNEQSDEVKQMATNWVICESLIGGTTSMRKAGKAYLPKWPREDESDWDIRKSMSTLLPAFKRTIAVMTGKPFSKAITFSDDLPEPIKLGFNDSDMQGNNLHSFASEVMQDALAFGISGVLVDVPRTNGTNKTKADDKALGVRPYLVHIKHDQILGWKSERINGAMVLTQLRISMSVSADDGEYGTKQVNQVLELTRGAFKIHQESEKGYVVVDEGFTTIKVIPFVPFYGRKQGFMCGISPLLDLAHLNVKHWQHQSDQDDSAVFSRKRLLAFIGIDNGAQVVVSSNGAINVPLGGDIKIVQGSAEAVTIGRTELQALEQHMIMTGAEILQPRADTLKTATQSVSEDEANKCELQRITEQFEDGLDMIVDLQCQQLGIKPAGNVTLFKDFAANMLSDASAQLIISMADGGFITKQTALIEMQRRGILSADIDPETELEEVDAQPPSLGTLDGNGQQ
jgi:hypothetical protein